MPQSTEAKERRRATAREKLVKVTEDRKAAEDKADRLRRKQFRFILKSHQSGLTYREIAAVTGLTEIRIAQILRAEREAA
jgi:DNA-directed RNA polymerase specialized sigma24 family protein